MPATARKNRFGGARSPVGGQGVAPQGVPLAGGTLGGKSAMGRKPGRYQTKLGDEHYLWILVILEVVAIGWLRHAFRRRHGG